MAAAFQQQRSDVGLGASEVASAIGLNPYETPFELWLRKTGQAPEKEQQEAMLWGNLLEGAILAEYRRRLPLDLGVDRCEASVFSDSISWARATPDAWLLEQGVRIGVVQVKNVGRHACWSWREAPPDYVQIQVMWELDVTKLGRGDVAALLGGTELRSYTVWRDDSMIEDLRKAAAKFWRFVETNTPPPADESDACRDYWGKRAGQIVIENDKDIDRLARLLRDEKNKAKEAKVTAKRVANLIAERIAMAGANGAQTSEGFLSIANRRGSVSWKKIAEKAGLVHLGDQFRGKDTTFIRAPKDWGVDDED